MEAICKSCGEERPLTDFYKGHHSRDCRTGKCKECVKESVKANRLVNLGYYKEYDRRRFQDDPRVISRHRRYQTSPNGLISSNTAKAKWDNNNPLKRAASNAVNNAVRGGKLTKPNSCSDCGKEKSRIHGHHDDYAFPLVVRWLCPRCHTAWHKENGEAANGAAQ